MFTKMIFVNNCEGSMSKQVNSHKVQKVIKSNCYESYHLDVIFVSLFEMDISCIYSPRYILYYSPLHTLYLFTSVYFVFVHLGIFMTVAARREGRMYASDLPGRSCTWDTDNVLDNDNG